jgi:hypothetical protein
VKSRLGDLDVRVVRGGMEIGVRGGGLVGLGE